jgi:hypothetical protein
MAYQLQCHKLQKCVSQCAVGESIFSQRAARVKSACGLALRGRPMCAGKWRWRTGINVRERTDQMSVKSWDDARGIGEMNVAGGRPTWFIAGGSDSAHHPCSAAAYAYTHFPHPHARHRNALVHISLLAKHATPVNADFRHRGLSLLLFFPRFH